ncbi:hypothetical protein [Arthrobacter luteolus]|uniref:hypothetical protein n=1 Tax=Arthrobacter luteolus TaxID=98672 RepID=UPI00384AB61D
MPIDTRARKRKLGFLEFEAPFGPLGRLMEKLVLARYLRNLIETRNRFLVMDSTQRQTPGG